MTLGLRRFPKGLLKRYDPPIKLNGTAGTAIAAQGRLIYIVLYSYSITGTVTTTLDKIPSNIRKKNKTINIG